MIETIEMRWGVAANALFRLRKFGAVMPPAALWPALCMREDGWPYTEPAGTAKGPTVAARVNHGVWQAVCPFCASAQHASLDDMRFYCARCNNAPAEHQFLVVRFPKDAEAITAELANRPLPMFRNWEPGETLADLRRQDTAAINRGLTGVANG